MPGLADQVANHAAEHGALRPDARLDPGQRRHEVVPDGPVGGEVVLPVQQVVVDPRDIRRDGSKPPIGTSLSATG